MLRILLDQLRAAEDERNALVLRPWLRAVRAVIDAGAGGGMHVFRIRRIDDDAHHVGVVDHALADMETNSCRRRWSSRAGGRCRRR